MKKILIILSLFLVLFWSFLPAFSEEKIIILVLKSGKKITGKMISFDSDKKTITLDNNGKPVIYDYNTNATGENAVAKVFKGDSIEKRHLTNQEKMKVIQEKFGDIPETNNQFKPNSALSDGIVDE